MPKNRVGAQVMNRTVSIMDHTIPLEQQSYK